MSERSRLIINDFVPFKSTPLSGVTKNKRKTFSDEAMSIASLLEEPLKAKIVVIGDPSVGKTSALNVLQTSSFTAGYKATVGVDFFYMNFSLAGVPIDTVLWDTAGQETFRSLSTNYYRNTQAVIMFFDLSNRATFDHILTTWISDVRHNVTPDPQNVLIFLVGNKSDLLRTVTREEAHECATMIGAEYFEVSAATDDIDAPCKDSLRRLMERIVVCLFESMTLTEYHALQARKIEERKNFKPVANVIHANRTTKRDQGTLGERCCIIV